MNNYKKIYVVLLVLPLSTVVMYPEPEQEELEHVVPAADGQRQDEEFAQWRASVTRSSDRFEQIKQEKVEVEKPSVLQRITDRFSFRKSAEPTEDVKLNKKIDTLKKSVQKSFENTLESIDAFASSVKKKFATFGKNLTKSAQDLVNKATDFFDKPSNPSAKRMIKNAMKDLHQQAQEMVQDTKALFADEDEFDLDTIKAKTSKFFEKLSDRIKEVVSDVNAKLHRVAKKVGL